MGLGWMRLENYFYGKKVIFIRTILGRKDNFIYRNILRLRADRCNENIEEGMNNTADRPIFDWLRIAILFGIYDLVMNMILGKSGYLSCYHIADMLPNRMKECEIIFVFKDECYIKQYVRDFS